MCIFPGYNPKFILNLIVMTSLSHDHLQRERAINTTQSFIVQAPAGSGKTSLLVQRYLALLATVSHPEEIIAITFTRKAAAEMQERIIHALEYAASNQSNNTNPHYVKTIELARQVLHQDAKQQWHLQSCPYRLRLQTIDALCLNLVNQAPFAANMNSAPNIVEGQDATKYYKLAAQSVLNELENHEFKDIKHLETLLLALDNDVERCLNLFINMLQKREQWLPYIVGIRNYNKQALRLALENSLANVAQETISQCQNKFPKNLQQEIIALANFAQTNLQDSAKKHDLEQHVDFKEFFSNIKPTKIDQQNFISHGVSQLPHLFSWQQLTKLLLTEKGEWRKCADKTIGFPAPANAPDKETKAIYQDMKQRYIELIEQLQHNTDLLHSLREITYLPALNYNEQQWQVLCALVELLPIAAAELDLIFHEHGVVDYTAVSMAAERALGNNETPSDLALQLDYRIKHILVDEFQDISQAQYRLLEKLTAGWENGDGRTLFLVGDPMQSIYRFRQAEVGLFLRAAQDGIGTIKPEPLQLTSNFRSTTSLVHWFNKTFSQIFPPFADIALGCIPFSAAFPNNSISPQPNQNSAEVHALVTPKSTDTPQLKNTEAQHVVGLVKKIITDNPQDSIAILVSARHHLNFILSTLRTANIPFNAVELENLNESAVIQDLFALTCALTDITDRISWLAILRAPWAGLCLGDLHAIANANNEDKLKTTIWENINSYEKISNISENGKKRIAQLLPILQNSFYNRGRENLRNWIEETWLAIGGPATVQTCEHLNHAEQFWQLLETTASSSHTINIELLAQKLEQLHTGQSNPDACVQIMTIHKAKGLEFDHVIVSGLDRTTRSDDKQLIMWLERPRLHNGSDLLLAPLKEVGAVENTIYNYLRHIEQQKDYYENTRLLYVASTRAKKTLNLVACVTNNTEETCSKIKAPAYNSLLHQLWPCFSADWLLEINNNSSLSSVSTILSQEQKIITTQPTKDWQYPVAELAGRENTKIAANATWRSNKIDDAAARFGTVAHKCILQLTQNLTTEKNIAATNYYDRNFNYWKKLLKQNGFYHNEIETNLEKIRTITTNFCNDLKGQWILSQQHQKIHNEYAITAVIDNKIKNLIIDRTFITPENILWIIDYKTSEPNVTTNLANFLAAEKNKYQPQLELYAQAMKLRNKATNKQPHTIMLGLYFPLCQGWCEWEYLG